MSQIIVGVDMLNMPIVTDCAHNMTTWTPPLPLSCPVIGLFPQIFSMIAQYIGLNYRVVLLNGSNYGSYGGVDHGTIHLAFDGYLGMLQRGEVDVIASSYEWGEIRAKHFNYLRPIRRSKVAALINYREGTAFYENAVALVNQIGIDLWICFISIYLCLQRLAKYADVHSKTASKAALVCQIMLTLHFANIYKGTLLSTYLLGPAEPSDNVFEEAISKIERNQMQLVVSRPTGLVMQLLKSSTDPQLKRLLTAISHNPPVYYANNIENATQLLNDDQAMFLAHDESLFYKLLLQNCNLRVIDLNIGTPYDTYSSMVVRKELTNLTNRLTNAMDQLSMPSLVPIMMESYYREINYNQMLCSAMDQAERDEWSGITLINLSGPIFMIFVVGVIACGVVICEFLAHRSTSKER